MDCSLMYPNGDVIFYSKNNLPKYSFSFEDRKKARFFQSNYSVYRIISSASIQLIKTAKNRVIFLTFTFNAKLKISEKDANKIWNTFVKNFRKTYKLNNYLGVLELTKVGTPHYHFLCDYPFVDINKINDSWVTAIDNFYNNIPRDFILGSVQLPKDYDSVVDEPTRLIRYICKYFTKTIGIRYNARNYFISRELRRISRPIVLSHEKEMLLETFGTVYDKLFSHVRISGYKHEVFDIINQLNETEYYL